ncbi:MAG: hypothetical protein ACLFQ0_12430, partial [Cyclobacteriaceae bacterium]
MEKLIYIRYKSGAHRGEARIFLDTPYEEGIIEKIKMIPGRKWSKTRNCWHVPDNNESMRYINRLIEIYSQEDEVRQVQISTKPLAGERTEEKKPVQHQKLPALHTPATSSEQTVADKPTKDQVPLVSKQAGSSDKVY